MRLFYLGLGKTEKKPSLGMVASVISISIVGIYISLHVCRIKHTFHTWSLFICMIYMWEMPIWRIAVQVEIHMKLSQQTN